MIKNILIIDNEISICNLLSKFLGKNGYETECATSGKQALELLKEKNFKLAICDYKLGDMSGNELLPKMQALAPEMIVIFISGYGDINTAVNLMKSGAYDFLTKPLYPDQVLDVVKKAFSTLLFETKADELQTNYVKGESTAAQRLFEHVTLVAPTDYSVIIHGETGTGKEALARFLHEGSCRKDQPFIAIDCGSLSKDLATSELFGHEKGAFTGAQQSKKGAFEQADGGTLFLDEIGNLPYSIQAFLLRAIQEKRIRKIGGVKEIDVDVRFIVATNEDLFESVKKKTFREDLYHRLNEFTLEVPALRDRREDIPLFVQEFIRQAEAKLGRKIKGVSAHVWELLTNYSWPGNIRELQNVIKRACLLVKAGCPIDESSLPFELLEEEDDDSAELQSPAIAPTTAGVNSNDLKEVTFEAEKQKILNILKKVNYNKSKAAQILNIDRKTLYNKLKKMEEEI